MKVAITLLFSFVTIAGAVDIKQGYEPNWYIDSRKYDPSQGITVERDRMVGEIGHLRKIHLEGDNPCITFPEDIDVTAIGTEQLVYMKPWIPVDQPQITNWIYYQGLNCADASVLDPETYLATKSYSAQYVATSWKFQSRTAAGNVDLLFNIRSILPVFANRGNIGGTFVGISDGVEYTEEDTPAWKFLRDSVVVVYEKLVEDQHREKERYELSYSALRQLHQLSPDAARCVPIEPNVGVEALVTTEYHQVLEAARGIYNEETYAWYINKVGFYDNEHCHGQALKTYSWLLSNENDGLMKIYNPEIEEAQWIFEPDTDGAQGVRGIKLIWSDDHHGTDDDDNDNDGGDGGNIVHILHDASDDFTPTSQQFTGVDSQASVHSSNLDRDHIFGINPDDVLLPGEEMFIDPQYDNDEQIDEGTQGYSISEADPHSEDEGPKKKLKKDY